MGYRIGIDSGGTFTDLQAVSNTGEISILKVPSTPQSPDQGFRHAIEAFLTRINGDAGAVESICHGTTVAVNAVLEGKFPPIGLIVTRGFRHILEMGRQTVPGERGAIYVWVKPPRIVPLGNVEEVTERVSAQGDVLTPLTTEECRAAARSFKEKGIDTVAVCLLNSYVNGSHEQRIRDLIVEEHPSCFVALSTETLPEFREYERAITTSMNALLMPILGTYVSALENHLTELGVSAPLYIMKSAGCASRADVAVTNPVYTALSGPAASVVGAAWIGRHAGFPDLITFDMGGTSSDVSLVENGEPQRTTEVELDIYPLRSPCIDVVSIGAGGGSKAWLAPGDRLAVGPRSAGANPGPACYGLGGRESTITDANLVLGRLPTHLADETIVLDQDLATQALHDLGVSLNLSPIELANGIIKIAELNMADAIRQVSVQKGRDPRLFTLIAAGGAGPLHAASLGEILQVKQVLIPPSPGIGCSLGALVSDVREDLVMTDIQNEVTCDRDRIRKSFLDLEQKALKAVELQAFSVDQRRILRSADLRYRGMRTELTVPVTSDELTDEVIGEMFECLHGAHETAYGYSYPGRQTVELVNIRATGLGLMAAVQPYRSEKNGDDESSKAIKNTRKVFFEPGGWTNTPVYDRAKLFSGMSLIGPAVIEQYDSTVIILPGQTVVVDDHANLLVQIKVHIPELVEKTKGATA